MVRRYIEITTTETQGVYVTVDEQMLARQYPDLPVDEAIVAYIEEGAQWDSLYDLFTRFSVITDYSQINLYSNVKVTTVKDEE